MSRLLLAALLLAAGAPAFAADEDEAAAQSGLMLMGGMNVMTDSEAPLALLGASQKEIPKGAVQLGEVKGRACQNGIAIPISLSLRRTSVTAAGGKGGFARALSEMKKQKPDMEGISDVRVDVQRVSILRVFQRSCLELTARAWKR